jgi:cysteine desulfurase
MIYLDYNATAPVHPKVISAMQEYQNLAFNASSVHANGRLAKSLLEQARHKIARLLGFHDIFKDYQIIFTSSGTEANNLLLHNYAIINKDADIFISAIEHPSIFMWQNYAPNIKLIPVDKDGIVQLEALDKLLSTSDKSHKLVSVMMANNESGVIQPLSKITSLAKKYQALVHSDIIQTAGKIPTNLPSIDLDFATISAHKIGGPIGAAALIYKNIHHLQPMIIGGGQEKGIRSGTENVLAAMGFGQACEIAAQELTMRSEHCKNLQKTLEDKLESLALGVEIVGKNVPRLPNTTLLIHPSMTAETQLIIFDMNNIAVSSGSACSSGKIGKSYVLQNMGYKQEQTRSAIRVSTGSNTKLEDIETFLTIYQK